MGSQNDFEFHLLQEFISSQVLKRKIRNAEEPDSPQIIKQVFDIEKRLASHSIDQQRRNQISLCRLLCETVDDQTIPLHWRENCLNNIFRPLAALSSLSDGESSHKEINKIFERIRELKLPYQKQKIGLAKYSR